MFTLTLETSNEAFDDLDLRAFEVARILRTVAARVELGVTEGHARDINGNRVCTFSFEE